MACVYLASTEPSAATNGKQSEELGLSIHFNSENPAVDIVAIHGLNSSPSKAWTHQNGKRWVSDPEFLETITTDARVMTFGYNANVFGDITRGRIVDHARGLLEALCYERRNHKNRPLIFVAHSLGGLVVKMALLEAKHDKRYEEILISTSAILFMGTPHHGAEHTGILEYAERLVAWATWKRAAASELTEELKIFSNTIVDINRNFRPTTIEIVDFYELVETRLPLPKMSGLIVEAGSAIMSGNPNERHVPSYCNHEELPKFEHPQDVRFKSFRMQLVMVIENTHKVQEEERQQLSKAKHRLEEDEELNGRFRDLPVPKTLDGLVINPYKSSPHQAIMDAPKVIRQSKQLILPQRETKTLSTVEYHSNDFFYGRDQVLGELHQYVQPEIEGNDSRLKTCVLFGLGGVGKTQTTVEYTYRYGSAYSYIFWIPAEEPSEISKGFGTIAEMSSQPGQTFDNQQQNRRLALEWLSTTTEPWLLIFDNVVQHKDLAPYLPRTTHGSVIVTTQSRNVEGSMAHRIALFGFNDKDGAALLLRYLHIGQEDDPDNLASEISKLVGGLPLALAHIGGYIYESNGTLREFINLFQDLPQTIWDSEPSSTSPYARSLSTVFDIALGALDKDSRDLINCMAFLNPDGIQEDMIFRQHKSPLLEFLNTRNRGRPEKIRRVLSARHLVERNGLKSAFSIHRYLALNLLYKLDQSLAERKEVFNQAFTLVRAVIPYQSPISSPTHEHWPAYERYLAHAIHLHTIYKQRVDSENPLDLSIKFAELLSDVAYYMRERNLLSDAMSMLATAEKICNHVLDPEDTNPTRTQIIYLQATLELDNGIGLRLQGVAHMERVLQLRRRHLESNSSEEEKMVDSMQLSTALNNLALAYMHCDDFERAEPMLQESLKMKKLWSTEESHPDYFAEAYKNLALLNLAMGRPEESLKLSLRGIEIGEKWSGVRTRFLQLHKFVRGCILFNIGNIDAALREHCKVLEIRSEVLGESHDQTLDSYYVVGTIYHKLNDLEKARKHLDWCLKFRESYYESRTARVLYRISRVYQDEGNDIESTRTYQQACELRNKLVPKTYPGLDLKYSEDEVIFDQMVSMWAGRLYHKLAKET
ncbi:hypothetical protein V492_06687 [Pseudogymnoascus sp. VKM F-4246]|nr:hypothetical protein V492_06687 [Pseudogymnoascus sp. VKM F-4246]